MSERIVVEESKLTNEQAINRMNIAAAFARQRVNQAVEVQEEVRAAQQKKKRVDPIRKPVQDEIIEPTMFNPAKRRTKINKDKKKPQSQKQKIKKKVTVIIPDTPPKSVEEQKEVNMSGQPSPALFKYMNLELPRLTSLSDSAAFNSIEGKGTKLERLPNFTLGTYNNVIPGFNKYAISSTDDPGERAFLGDKLTSNLAWFQKQDGYNSALTDENIRDILNTKDTTIKNFDGNFYSQNGRFYLTGINKPINKAVLAGLKVGSAASALNLIKNGEWTYAHQTAAHFKAANFLKKLGDAFSAFKSLKKELRFASNPTAASIKNLAMSSASKLKPNTLIPKGVSGTQMAKGINASNAMKKRFVADKNISLLVDDAAAYKNAKRKEAFLKRADRLGVPPDTLSKVLSYYSKDRNNANKISAAAIGAYGTEMDIWRSGIITDPIMNTDADLERSNIAQAVEAVRQSGFAPVNIGAIEDKTFKKPERSANSLSINAILQRLQLDDKGSASRSTGLTSRSVRPQRELNMEVEIPGVSS